MNRQDYHAQYGKEYRKTVKRVSTTFSPEEFDALARAAEASGLKPATFVHELCTRFLQGERVLSSQTTRELQGLSFLIRNIANNVNQAAKHSNRLKHVVDENRILAELRQLEQAVHDFVKREA